MQGENVVEKRILTLLSKEIMSTSQVAKKLNMRREVTVGYLEALRHQGKLEKTKVGKSIIYRTVQDDETVMILPDKSLLTG